MPAVVVDSSVLITLAAGEQFLLLREIYTSWLSEEVYRAALAQAGEVEKSR